MVPVLLLQEADSSDLLCSFRNCTQRADGRPDDGSADERLGPNRMKQNHPLPAENLRNM